MTEIPSHHQRRFSADDFRRRHQRVYDAIGPRAAAVVQGAPPVAGFEIFRQTNEFFHLTGLELPGALLLLDGRSRRSVLFVPHRDEHHAAAGEGDELSAEDGDLLMQVTGCDDVAGPEDLVSHLRGAGVIYTPHQPAEGNMACQDTLRQQAKLLAADPWHAAPPREQALATLLRERLGAGGDSVEIRDLSPILNGLRSIKNPADIALMRDAGKLTARAAVEAMRSTAPGVYEYQLGAVAEYVFRAAGARGASYRPIIATGENIWLIHYYRNNAALRAGELVLFDVAPDLCNYTSDIGRMWPVDGAYSDVQRQLYGTVTQFHQALLRRLRPGATADEVFTEAAADMRPVLARTRFARPIYEQAAHRLLARVDKALTHPVGMAVHDVGTYKSEPLRPGVVFALDPQLWVPEERLYIRVEDTVVITETGVESLTSDAPLELDEIESIVRRGGGMLQAFPPALPGRESA